MKTLRFLLLLILISFAKIGVMQESWYGHWIQPENTNATSVSINHSYRYGIICGASGYIGRWTEGVSDFWLPYNITPVTNFNFNSVYDVDSSNTIKAYIVGDVGRILKSNDIITWPNLVFYFQNSSTTKNLYSVYFPLYSNGVAVGQDGVVVRTTDGGSHWTTINSGTSNQLFSVQFPSNNTGYAVGVNGSVIKTTDNGQNWAAKTQPVNDTLRSVWFTSDNTGFVVGRNGGVYKTTDGGSSWTQKPSGTVLNLNAVRFVNISIGYIAGNNNLILRTTNAGDSWAIQTIQSLPRQGNFKGLSIDQISKVSSVGSNSTAAGNFPESGSISQFNKNESYLLSPNPANQKITISTPGSPQKESLVSIYNIQGELLLSSSFALQNPVEMDVSSLARGVYIIMIQSGNGFETKKLVIQ